MPSKDAWINESKPTKVAMDSLNDPNTKIVQLPYYLPDWNNITKADTEPDFQKVLLGKMTAKDFADELAGKINDAQADFAQHHKK